jgi:hypothetical protein
LATLMLFIEPSSVMGRNGLAKRFPNGSQTIEGRRRLFLPLVRELRLLRERLEKSSITRLLVQVAAIVGATSNAAEAAATHRPALKRVSNMSV